ncbi:hypothetical protein HYV82_01020 [Candidatus Woesearchaeota archaeon]|nr:hypothetical protein [Candidatus Woesearchaeota archaeon]
MPEHISHLECGLIQWIEDQPVIRYVREQMEGDGLINRLMVELESGRQNIAREVRQYTDRSGSPHHYLCEVQKCSSEASYPNSPSFFVRIKPNIAAHPWDAIGEVYVGDARKLMEELFKE